MTLAPNLQTYQNKEPLVFETKGRATFSDLDPYGHVNNTHYFSYFMAHRFEAMRIYLGWDLMTIHKLPIAFFIKKTEIEYIRPLLFDHEYTIQSYISELSSSSAHLTMDMKDDQGHIIAACQVVLVCIDKKTQKPCSWPEEVISKFYNI